MQDDPSAARGSREKLIERTFGTFQVLFQHMTEAHAPQFLEIPVTMPQAKVLYLVVGRGSLHMSELAARLSVTLSTVSGLVERLVEGGLVERREDPTDRRQIIVTATGLGRDLFERFQEVNAAHLRALLDRVPTADLVVVERAFGILSAAALSPQAQATTHGLSADSHARSTS